MSNLNEQYVYIHRDESGNPIYIGRGRHPTRAVSHQDDELSERLSEKAHVVQIAGPFQSVKASEDVEAALISAFKNTPSLSAKLINKAPGVTRGTFRPLGVPNSLAERVLEEPLDREALLKASDGKSVMCVLIKDHFTKDGRGGYHLAAVPSNKTIEERMVRSWDLGRNIEAWRQSVDRTPSILIALSGPIKHRMIVGALAIARDLTQFSRVGDSRLYQVPIARIEENNNLDFKRLRGRRIGQGVTKFSNIRPELFFIVEATV